MVQELSRDNRLGFAQQDLQLKEPTPLLSQLLAEVATATRSGKGDYKQLADSVEKQCSKRLSESGSLTARDRYSRSLDKYMGALTRSLPARQGEGYRDVLERMLPRMKSGDLDVLAHDAETLNGNRPLQPGQKFEILGSFGKNLLKTQLMNEYDRGDNPSESKSRSRFSPAYNEAMKFLGERVGKAAEAEAKITKSELLNSGTPASRPEGEKSSAEKKGERKSSKESKEQDKSAIEDTIKTPERAMSDFADSCQEFAKRGETLLFLSRWYPPESNTYIWGEEKFFAASAKSHKDFEQLQEALKTEEERQKLEKEWQCFLARQNDLLNNLQKSLPVLDDSTLALDSRS